MIRQTLVAAMLSGALVCPSVGEAADAGKVGTSPSRVVATETGPTWASLAPAAQAALAPLKQHWSGIDASRKSKWLVVAQRFPSLPPLERQRVQERMAEWASMTPAERGRARQNFQELRNLPHADRQALWEAYRALPDEQRQALAQGTKVSARTPESASAPSGKRSVAVNPAPVIVKPVSPTVVQAKPGATTTLVTKAPSPPAHHQPGLPKIAATDEFVNPTTLLPSRGPQGAATHPATASGTETRP